MIVFCLLFSFSFSFVGIFLRLSRSVGSAPCVRHVRIVCNILLYIAFCFVEHFFESNGMFFLCSTKCNPFCSKLVKQNNCEPDKKKGEKIWMKSQNVCKNERNGKKLRRQLELATINIVHKFLYSYRFLIDGEFIAQYLHTK